MAHSTLSVERIISRLDEYLSRNDTDGARRHLLYWLDEAISEQNSRVELLLRNELMGLYRKGGQMDLAIENANIAMRKIEEMGVEDQLGSATTYLNCATVYKAFGMAYVRFANEEPELFKLLFMRDRRGMELITTHDFDASIEMIMESSNISRESATLMHLEMWTSVHGIATMLATSFLSLEWELISDILTDVYQGLRKRHLSEENKQ